MSDNTRIIPENQATTTVLGLREATETALQNLNTAIIDAKTSGGVTIEAVKAEIQNAVESLPVVAAVEVPFSVK